MIAASTCYRYFVESVHHSRVSGSNRLAASDGPGRRSVGPGGCHSTTSDVWLGGSDAPSLRLRPFESRRGPRTPNKGRVCSVRFDRQRVASGAGDTPLADSKAETGPGV